MGLIRIVGLFCGQNDIRHIEDAGSHSRGGTRDRILRMSRLEICCVSVELWMECSKLLGIYRLTKDIVDDIFNVMERDM